MGNVPNLSQTLRITSSKPIAIQSGTATAMSFRKYSLKPRPVVTQRATATKSATAVCSWIIPAEPFFIYEWHIITHRKRGLRPHSQYQRWRPFDIRRQPHSESQRTITPDNGQRNSRAASIEKGSIGEIQCMPHYFVELVTKRLSYSCENRKEGKLPSGRHRAYNNWAW